MKILIEIPNVPGASDVKIEDVFAKVEIICGNKYVQYAKAKILEVDGCPCASPTASSFWNYHRNIVWDIQRDIREVLPMKNNEPDQDFYKNKMWGNDPIQKPNTVLPKSIMEWITEDGKFHRQCLRCCLRVDVKGDPDQDFYTARQYSELMSRPLHLRCLHGLHVTPVEDTKEFLLREMDVVIGVLNKIVRRLND